jgi:hypothetical protein
VVAEDVYAAIEAGECLPEDGRAFLTAVAASYKLRRVERVALGEAFGRQHLIREFGDDFAGRWFAG